MCRHFLKRFGSNIVIIIYSYRGGKEPEKQIGVVLFVNGKVTGIAEHPVRLKHVRHFGQLLGPEYLAVAQVRREQQRIGGRMGRRELGIP